MGAPRTVWMCSYNLSCLLTSLNRNLKCLFWVKVCVIVFQSSRCLFGFSWPLFLCDDSLPQFPKCHWAQKWTTSTAMTCRLHEGIRSCFVWLQDPTHQPSNYAPPPPVPPSSPSFLIRWSDHKVTAFFLPSSLRFSLPLFEEFIRVTNHPGWPENFLDSAQKVSCPRERLSPRYTMMVVHSTSGLSCEEHEKNVTSYWAAFSLLIKLKLYRFLNDLYCSYYLH